MLLVVGEQMLVNLEESVGTSIEEQAKVQAVEVKIFHEGAILHSRLFPIEVWGDEPRALEAAQDWTDFKLLQPPCNDNACQAEINLLPNH